MSLDPTAEMVDFALQLQPRIIPAKCLEIAQRCLLDFFAVALAGSREPIAGVLAQYLSEQKGEASVIGCRYKTSLEGAAFANGTLGHILDYDDVKSRIGHATVVIAPPLLALGEKLQKSGLDILTSFVAGFEIASRIANSLEPAHSLHGWHTTATCGVFGATVACAKLLALDADALRGALGLAGSLAGGLRINFGTPAKPIHAGHAAQNGLKAARLASLGIGGRPDIFTGKRGFGAVYASTFTPSELTRQLGEKYEILNNGFKRYPCCASSHTAIDAVLALRREHKLNPQDIAEIRVGTVPLVRDNLIYNNPENMVECRFSMPFCLSLAALDGKVTIENFSATRLTDPRMQALMPKVSLNLDPEMGPLGYRGTGNSRVTILTKQGDMFTKRVDVARGHFLNPLTDDELTEKFQVCARTALPESGLQNLQKRLISIKELSDISELFDFEPQP